MRRVIAALALGLCLLGCAPSVPLRIDNAASAEDCCLLSFMVIDVVADPTFGTVNKADGAPLTWPPGYTGRWAGSEVEVLDPAGKVVLTTGGRYWLSPLYPPWDRFVVGEVRLCPDCELGGGPL
jgi:hypothetical protein